MPVSFKALPSSAMMSGSSAFILLVNSKQVTPSPMSHSAAEPFLRIGLEVSLTSESMITPSGRFSSR